MFVRWQSWFPVMLFVLLIGPTIDLHADEAARTKPLNFVVLMVDDLGWADLGCYSADLHETPHIDRLAKQSMKFTDAYASAPVCTPTRAAVMTGKYPARLHMTIWREAAINRVKNRKLLPPDTVRDLPQPEVTFAEVLKSAGYITAHVGKWHLGDAAHYPQNQGFDINIGGTLWGCPATFFYPYRGRLGRAGVRYIPDLHWGREGEYLTDRLTDEALTVIEQAGDKPFFLNMCYYTVHTPIEAKKAMVDHYKQKLRPGLLHVNPTYAAMVHSLDESVGRILAQLDKMKLADRTVVIFSSDNGGFLGWKDRKYIVTDNTPLRSGKGSLYEGGVRVPLIVHWPDVASPGSVCDEPVASMDFYPTILEMAGLEGDAEHTANMDGLSLVPLLKDARKNLNRDALFWHFPHYYSTTDPVSSVRAGDWKLMEFHEDMRVELYNLREDLGEQMNLADKMPQRANQLRKQLHAWREKLSAQMPVPNPDRK